MPAHTTPIPEPPGLPILGNIFSIDAEASYASWRHLAEKYGEIYRVRFPGTSLVIVCTHALADEACDETRFQKVPASVLAEIRRGVHDGLFTAHLEEPNWGIAHRVLMPAFGPMGIANMFDEMHDIATQLVLKWVRHGEHTKINITDDLTRLTLDTISLCSMGFRFNSYYSEDLHPFVTAMCDFLTECGRRSQRLPLPSFWYRKDDADFASNINALRDTAQQVLQERLRATTTGRKDLLTAMLEGRDSVSDQKMSEESIIDNLITFLIAGHETTSGMLSYAIVRSVQIRRTPDLRRYSIVNARHSVPIVEAPGGLRKGPAGGRRSCRRRIHHH